MVCLPFDCLVLTCSQLNTGFSLKKPSLFKLAQLICACAAAVITGGYADLHCCRNSTIAPLTAITLYAGDWAAFITASTVQPEAPATASAIMSQDSGWDAFQSSDVAAPAGSAGAAVPFDPFGESQSIEAAPGGQKAAGAPSVGTGVPPSTAPKHATKKSANDIMKMFDTPQQNAFAQFPAFGMSQGHAAAMPGFAMQQVSNWTQLYVTCNIRTISCILRPEK